MSWNTAKVDVYMTTMDPGVTNCSSNKKVYTREELKVGQYLSFDDPSRTLASVKVLEITDAGLLVQVGNAGSPRLIEPGDSVLLDKTGYNYTYFELEVRLVEAH